MASWTDMPQDIGQLILDKLPEVIEHVRFGVVCKFWNAILMEYQRLHMHPRRALPMLLIPSPDAPAKPEQPRFFALSSAGQYYQNLHHCLPFSRFRYCGSSNGWLATQNEDFTVTLLYPFGSELLTIHLPRLRYGCMVKHDFHIHKLILTPKSMPDDYTVVVIYGDRHIVATIKSGEDSWTDLYPGNFCFHDIIFFNKKVYAVTTYFAIVRINIEARPLRRKIIRSADYSLRYLKSYLVESTSSDLFVLGRIHYNKQYEEDELHHEVAGHLEDAELEDEDVGDDENFTDDDNYDDDEEESDEDHDEEGEGEYEDLYGYDIVKLTEKFNVYKLKLDERSGEVLEMMETKHLDGDAFFIGENESMSFSARCFPGCKSNVIYFTDDLIHIAYYEPNGPEDVGCYNVEDGSLNRFYSMNPYHKKNVAQPIWIVPRYGSA